MAKSILNELYQRLRTAAPVYATQLDIEQEGFVCDLTLPAVDAGLEPLCTARAFCGSGSTKKEAEQAAANEAVDWLRAEGLLSTDASEDGKAQAASFALVGSKRAKDLEDDDADTLEQRILDVLASVHPKALTGAQLAKLCGHFKLKSKVNHLLYARLRSHSLVDMLDTTPPPVWRASAALLQLVASGATRLVPPPELPAGVAAGGRDDVVRGDERAADGNDGDKDVGAEQDMQQADPVDGRVAAAEKHLGAVKSPGQPQGNRGWVDGVAAGGGSAAGVTGGGARVEAATAATAVDDGTLGSLLEALPQRLVIRSCPCKGPSDVAAPGAAGPRCHAAEAESGCQAHRRSPEAQAEEALPRAAAPALATPEPCSSSSGGAARQQQSRGRGKVAHHTSAPPAAPQPASQPPRSPWTALSEKAAGAATASGSQVPKERPACSQAAFSEDTGASVRVGISSTDTASSARRAAEGIPSLAQGGSPAPSSGGGAAARQRGMSPFKQQQQQQRWLPTSLPSPTVSGSGGGGGGSGGGNSRDPGGNSRDPSGQPSKPHSKSARAGQSSKHRLGSQQHLQQLVELQQQQLLQLQRLLILQQSQQLRQEQQQQQQQQPVVQGFVGNAGIARSWPVASMPVTDVSVDQVAALLQRQLLHPGIPTSAAGAYYGGGTTSGGLACSQGRAQLSGSQFQADQRAAAAAAAFVGLGSSFAGMGLGSGGGGGSGGNDSNGGACGLTTSGGAAIPFTGHSLAPFLPSTLYGASPPGQPALGGSAAGAAMPVSGQSPGEAFGAAAFGVFGAWPPPSPSASRSVSYSGATSSGIGQGAGGTGGQGGLEQQEDLGLSPAVLAALSEAAALEPAPVGPPAYSGASGAMGLSRAAAAACALGAASGGHGAVSLSSQDPVDAAPGSRWGTLCGAGLLAPPIAPPHQHQAAAPTSLAPKGGSAHFGTPSQPPGGNAGSAAVDMDAAAADCGTSIAGLKGRGANETGIKRKAPADSAPLSTHDSGGGDRDSGGATAIGAEPRSSLDDHMPAAPPPGRVGVVSGAGAPARGRRRGAASSRHPGGKESATLSGSSSGGGSRDESGEEDNADGAAASCANSSVAGGGAGGQSGAGQLRVFGSSRGFKSSRVEQHPGLAAAPVSELTPQDGSGDALGGCPEAPMDQANQACEARDASAAAAVAAAAAEEREGEGSMAGPVGAGACSEEQASLLLSRLQLPVTQQDLASSLHLSTAGAASQQQLAPLQHAPRALPGELQAEYEKRVEAVREALVELRRFEMMHGDCAAEGAGQA